MTGAPTEVLPTHTIVAGGLRVRYLDWPGGAPVFLRLRVDPQGNVAECIVDRGTGVAAIDSEVCNIVRRRLHFRPALNAAGQAVAGWFGYVQPPPR